MTKARVMSILLQLVSLMRFCYPQVFQKHTPCKERKTKREMRERDSIGICDRWRENQNNETYGSDRGREKDRDKVSDRGEQGRCR